jgi:hypothetical protein
MALGLNKIIIAGATSNTNGAYFQTVTQAATTAGNLIPAGTYLMVATANVFVTANTGAATSNVITINNGGVLISDGVNVYANATTNATVTLLTVNGGAAVSGTYNS